MATERLRAMAGSVRAKWRSPEGLLLVMALAMPIAFSVWQALLNNFAIERAAFTGAEIGILQSLREVPGFMAFTAVFVLLVLREQTFALISLLLLGIGTALTGFFPTVVGLYATTVLMSIGFHYFETLRQSLAMQWVSKEEAPHFFGRMVAWGAFASLATYGGVYVALDVFHMSMLWIYVLGGGGTCALVLFGWLAYPRYKGEVEQHKHLVLRARYWLYYCLIFMSGARRQIFIVFASFLMVERFGFDAGAIALMFLVNGLVNMLCAGYIGRLIGRWGERRALTFEYIGLIGVFTCYAFVETAWVAVVLYVVDNIFFTLAIALKTYLQKIADPADIASTAGVSFTINHIAAVAIPASFGLLWLVSPGAVFLAGAAMATVSLLLARMVPERPAPGMEVLLPGRVRRVPAAAAE
jgi:hypothetical protein